MLVLLDFKSVTNIREIVSFREQILLKVAFNVGK